VLTAFGTSLSQLSARNFAPIYCRKKIVSCGLADGFEIGSLNVAISSANITADFLYSTVPWSRYVFSESLIWGVQLNPLPKSTNNVFQAVREPPYPELLIIS